MSDLTTACSALPRGLRQERRPAGERDFVRTVAGILSWLWLHWRRREIIRALQRVDDHLLRDAGIERAAIEDFVDTLIARWR